MGGSKLDVLISGNYVGELSQDENGSLAFRYSKDYRGVPLSSAMPLSTREYRDKELLPYLWGLLPEDLATRKHVAIDAGISPYNPFALLGVIGLDCPGAVQFCNIESRAMQEERLIPITEADIARRLSQSQNNGSAWISENEHWSLGGQQSKFALRKQNGEWFSCEGSAATTHILKSGIRELDHQALNEYVCMSLAKECGINTASVEYSEFSFEKGVEPAIIIERYDRQVFNDKVVRLHQEDLCQALGCLPDNKYTMHGGPSCSDILRLLSSTGLSAQANVVQFVQMLFFNYLLAATDAHAKNYSLMLSNDGNHILAPMYDVASIAPYIEERRWGKKPPKLAMSIGGENRIGYLTPNHLSKFVTQCNLDAFGITVEGCIELLSCFAEIIPEKLSKVFDNLNSTSSEVAAKGLRALMEKPIIQLCRTTVQRFSSQ